MTRKTRKRSCSSASASAVAVFDTPDVQGHVLVTPHPEGVRLAAHFTRLPPGAHGFHIHRAGDMRQKDCSGLCEHYQKGTRKNHGAGPSRQSRRQGSQESHGSQESQDRHTGDLGNLKGTGTRRYVLHGVRVHDLWGRSIIVHADKDDLGKGHHDDSHTTGHSGARIACAIVGRL